MRIWYQKRIDTILFDFTLQQNNRIMDVVIKYKDIISRCEQLSSFESEGKADANGESRYLEIHINKVDEQLILQYIEQARGILEERMARMITLSENTVKEETTQETIGPSVTREFAEIVPNGSTMSDYEVIEAVQTSAPSSYDIVFMNAVGKFGYRVAGRQDTTSGYTVYTDMSALGLNPSDYLYDEDVLKTYRNKTEGYKQHKWNDAGNGLVEYTGTEEVIVTTFVPAISWLIRKDTRWNGVKTFVKHINEAIVSYAMAAWLRGKLDDRVPFYETLFNNSLNLAVRNIFTKQAPRK